jgi:hypothetical protein
MRRTSKLQMPAVRSQRTGDYKMDEARRAKLNDALARQASKKAEAARSIPVIMAGLLPDSDEKSSAPQAPQGVDASPDAQ